MSCTFDTFPPGQDPEERLLAALRESRKAVHDSERRLGTPPAAHGCMDRQAPTRTAMAVDRGRAFRWLRDAALYAVILACLLFASAIFGAEGR